MGCNGNTNGMQMGGNGFAKWYAMECDGMHGDALKCNGTQWNSMGCKEMQWRAMECNAMMACNGMQMECFVPLVESGICLLVDVATLSTNYDATNFSPFSLRLPFQLLAV